MFQIVKLQAIARGRKIRRSDIGLEVQRRCTRVDHRHLVLHSVGLNPSMQIAKLSANGFVRKILALSPRAMPLHFQYDSNDTNSVLSWLERWSRSHFWQPLPRPKRVNPPKSQKLSIPKPSATNVDSTASELDKPRRNLRKASTDQSANLVEDNPQLVLERIKRNLRKVHNPVLESTVEAETESQKKGTNENTKIGLSEPERTNNNAKKIAIGLAEPERTNEKAKKIAFGLSEPERTNDKPKKTEVRQFEPERTNDKPKKTVGMSEPERTPELPAAHEAETVKTGGNENDNEDENVHVMKERTCADDPVKNEMKKPRRRSSVPEKQEFTENNEPTQMKRSVPSYMAATESAKAKLRGLESADKNNLTRRYSLPSSANGNAGSLSPRVQRQIQTAGKVKTDRSLQLSRDGNVKLNQAEWRR